LKSVSTRRIRRLPGSPAGPVWQRGYFERVVRSEREQGLVLRYIAENPLRWAPDPIHPQSVP